MYKKMFPAKGNRSTDCNIWSNFLFVVILRTTTCCVSHSSRFEDDTSTKIDNLNVLKTVSICYISS